MPGQAGPVYPPGQFSAWNRPSVRASWLGVIGNGDGSWESDAEPGYSVLATSDPSADATVTQTWAAMDDAGGWSPPPLARDVSAHTDGEGFPRVGPTGGRATAAPRAAFEAAGPAQETRRQPAPWDSAGQPATRPPATRPPASRPPASRPAVSRPPTSSEPPTSGPPTSGPPTSGPPTSGPPTRARPGRAGRAGPASPANRPAAASAAGARGAPPAQPAPWESGDLSATGRAGAQHGPSAARDSGETRRRSGRAATSADRRGGSGRTATPAGRRGSGLNKRSHRALVGLLMAPVVIVILVVAVIVYLGSRPVSTAGHAAVSASRPAVAPTPPTPTLGQWQHITSQAVDAQPLSVHELYPARFTVGGKSGIRTVERANTKCTNAVIGSTLRAAVSKAGCTQVVRASYLSTSRKMMATIGVLNLRNVAAAERVGKASGATEFIRQLPGPHGPTRNLTKGTGLEEAEVKGHYLILVWTEFANLHAPSGKKQRKQLMAFSGDLFAGTANVSLTSRMVTGKPAVP